MINKDYTNAIFVILDLLKNKIKLNIKNNVTQLIIQSIFNHN
jgi:hypothetical protein